MGRIKKALIIGDAMIPGNDFLPAFNRYLKEYIDTYKVGNWEEDWTKLQYRRLEVEKKGPEIEDVPEIIGLEDTDTEIFMGLFVPVSSKMMEALPNIKIIGVCRAGLENVDLNEANQRNILVFNVKGRNAEAVSDFTIGLMLAESRNIAKAHLAIKSGQWRKTFSNSDYVPQLKEKTIGIVGFGAIGRLVARKLSGFSTRIMVYDPHIEEDSRAEEDVQFVSLEDLCKESDFVTLHARLMNDNKGMIGEKEFALMKKTSYFINTGRAGLVDYQALIKALKENRIAGAGIDVFPTEPIPETDELIGLDNVTMTTHIAGTTTEAIKNSPGLLMEDIQRLLEGAKPRFVVNPHVLEKDLIKRWLAQLSKL